MTRPSRARRRAVLERTAAALGFAALAAACPAPPEEPCAGVQCALLPAFPTGSGANDVALSHCDGAQVAVATASFESRLVTHDLPHGEVRAAPFFAPVPDDEGNDIGASPWSLDTTTGGARAVVSLFGQSAVALADPCGGPVLDTVTVTGPDGTAQITPQPVVVTGARAFVGFTNVIAFSLAGEPPVLGPGTVAVFDIAGDTLTLDEVRAPAGCDNPQGLVAHDGDVLVSCSGALARGDDGGQEARSDGAVFVGSGPGAHRIDAARLAPGTPAVVNGCVVAGSLVDPVLLASRLDAEALAVRVNLPGSDVDAAFKVVPFGERTALAVQFSTDQLHIVDVGADCSLEITGSIAIGPGGVAFRGLLSIDTAPGEDIDAVALLGLSAELVPLRLREVLE